MMCVNSRAWQILLCGVSQMLILNKWKSSVTGSQHLVSADHLQEDQATPEYERNAARVSFDTAPLPLGEESYTPFWVVDLFETLRIASLYYFKRWLISLKKRFLMLLKRQLAEWTKNGKLRFRAPTLLLTSYMTKEKLFNLSVPQKCIYLD